MVNEKLIIIKQLKNIKMNKDEDNFEADDAFN